MSEVAQNSPEEPKQALQPIDADGWVFTARIPATESLPEVFVKYRPLGGLAARRAYTKISRAETPDKGDEIAFEVVNKQVVVIWNDGDSTLGKGRVFYKLANIPLNHLQIIEKLVYREFVKLLPVEITWEKDSPQEAEKNSPRG